jgi:hypothetical protein
MAAWVAGGAFVDAVIAVTLAEAIALAAWRRATGRGLAAADWAPNLAAGLCLMLALRTSLADAAWPWIVAALAGAGLAHAADLLRRLERAVQMARRPAFGIQSGSEETPPCTDAASCAAGSPPRPSPAPCPPAPRWPRPRP